LNCVAYPSYKTFFTVIDRQTALYFWETYPSPEYLKGKTAEELAEELRPTVITTVLPKVQRKS
jgi:hypothetical protein